MTSKCILVIDDEADIREIAKASLQITKNWEVWTASCGNEGMAIAESQQPDVILLDATMPIMDGLATLKRLRENLGTRHIPVIFLTAKVKTADRHQYAQLGAKAVLLKPFDPTTLADQVEAALGWNGQ
jgi:CheY-like chemotaxis protein